MSSGSFEKTTYVTTTTCGSGSKVRTYRYRAWSGTNWTANEPSSACHPYRVDWIIEDHGLCRRISTGAIGTIVTCYGGSNGPPSGWSSNDDLKLLEKLANKIRGSDFVGSSALGEIDESVRMIGDSARRVRYGLNSLLSGDTAAVIRGHLAGVASNRPIGSRLSLATRAMAERWLELSFGWLPLLQSAYDAGEALAKGLDGWYTKTVRASHSKITEGVTLGAPTLLKGSGFGCTRVQYIYTVTPKDSFAAKLALLGLLNPLSVAWERMPLSFAVDYFLPLGSYLDLAALYPFLTGSWCKSGKNLVSSRCETNDPSFVTLAGQSRVVGTFVRTCGTSKLNVPFPSFKSPVSPSWHKTANQLAALRVLL